MKIFGKNYFFLFGVCDKAEPATDLEFLLALPSRRIFEALLATRGDVVFCELFDFTAVTSFPFNKLCQKNYIIQMEKKSNGRENSD